MLPGTDHILSLTVVAILISLQCYIEIQNVGAYNFMTLQKKL